VRDLAVTCVLKPALIPRAPATAEVSAGISALALLGVVHRQSVPEDAIVAAGTDTARKVAAEAAQHSMFFGGILEVERELAHGD
jgi:hypothetical protein